MDSRLLRIAVQTCHKASRIDKFKNRSFLVSSGCYENIYGSANVKSRALSHLSSNDSMKYVPKNIALGTQVNLIKEMDLKIQASPICILTCKFSSKSGTDGNVSKSSPNQAIEETDPEKSSEKKPSLFQRFKQMYKEYWYVLIPVHTVTSIIWYGSFVYALKSGVDLVALLEQMGVGETILKPLKSNSAGYYALAYGMYKIATPARYAVTLGGTTVSINYLRKIGVIKPIPSKDRMKEIWIEKKDEMKDKRHQVIENWKSKRNKL